MTSKELEMIVDWVRCQLRVSIIFLLLPISISAEEIAADREKEELIRSIWNLQAGDALVNVEIEGFAQSMRSNVLTGQLNEYLFRIQHFHIQRHAPSVVDAVKKRFYEEMAGLENNQLQKIEKVLEGDIGRSYRKSVKESLDIRKTSMQLARKLPRLLADQKRVSAVANLVEDHFGPALESKWDFIKDAGMFGLTSASLVFEGLPAHFVEEERLLDQLEENKPNVILALNQTLLQGNLFSLRDLSVGQIKQYGSFLETTGGKRYTEISADASIHAMTLLFERILSSLVDAVEVGEEKWRVSSSGFLLKNIESEKCIDLPDGKAFFGANLIQWDCDGSPAQDFIWFEQKLRHAHTKNCFEEHTENWSGRSKTYLVQNECLDVPKQDIRMVSTGKDESSFYLKDSGGKKCLSVIADEETNGEPLRFLKCRKSKNQRFTRVENSF